VFATKLTTSLWIALWQGHNLGWISSAFVKETSTIAIVVTLLSTTKPIGELSITRLLRSDPGRSREILITSFGPYFGGVCSNGSLVYRTLSISITSATLPSGLRNGNGLPVYLCEIGSMYLKSPSGRRSTTRPRSWASL
jgi:hypothetical protein